MRCITTIAFALCIHTAWADGSPESEAFLAATNSLFCTVTNEVTAFVPSEWPPQVFSIMRPYISNPEINPATGSNIPSHVNGFSVDLNADGSKEYIFEVKRFHGTAGPFYVLLENIEGEWREAASLQGYFHLTASSTNMPIITYISRGGSEDYLKQEYVLRGGRLELLGSTRFRHGIVTDGNVRGAKQNRPQQPSAPGSPRR